MGRECVEWDIYVAGAFVLCYLHISACLSAHTLTVCRSTQAANNANTYQPSAILHTITLHSKSANKCHLIHTSTGNWSDLGTFSISSAAFPRHQWWPTMILVLITATRTSCPPEKMSRSKRLASTIASRSCPKPVEFKVKDRKMTLKT